MDRQHGRCKVLRDQTFIGIRLEPAPEVASDAKTPEFEKELIVGDAVEGLPEINVYNIRLSLGLERFMHAVEKGEELLSSGSVPKETKLTGRNETRNKHENMVIDDSF